MQIYITDKSGKKFWNTNVSHDYSQGERRNLQRHLAAIKAGSPAYAKCSVDADTAKIIEELNPFSEMGIDTPSINELLAELESQ